MKRQQENVKDISEHSDGGNGKEIVLVEQQHTFVPTIDLVYGQLKAVDELYRKVMKQNEHYGRIPGTHKDTLYKSGAEKLCQMFHLVAKVEDKEIVNLPGNHREYIVTIGLFQRENGRFCGQGVGSCSTMETKYRYRSVYQAGKKAKVENPDIADLYNTVYKMAYKRALVSATITATGVSDIFTQDVEDMNLEPARTEHPAKHAQQNPADRLTEIPDDLKAYFRKQELSKKAVWEICQKYNWNFDKIKQIFLSDANESSDEDIPY